MIGADKFMGRDPAILILRAVAIGARRHARQRLLAEIGIVAAAAIYLAPDIIVAIATRWPA